MDEAKLAWLRFYDDLETVLKRFRPLDYAMAVAQRMRRCAHEPSEFAKSPPHWLLHSVEAYCAYSRGQNHDTVDQRALARVMRVYYEHDPALADPYFAVGGRVGPLFEVMHLQQIEAQHEVTRYDLARSWHLFGQEEALPATKTAFEQTYRLSPSDWFAIAFLVYARASENSVFRPKSVSGATFVEVSEQAVAAYLSHVSLAPEAVAHQYRRDRASTSYDFHACIQSVLFGHPIIDLGPKGFLAVKPELIMRHAPKAFCALARVCADAAFTREFGSRFEQYVLELLRDVPKSGAVITEDQIADCAQGKKCDFVVELSDAVVLIECKAVTRTSRILI